MQRVQPETRTHNTAIIACNMCNQSAKALQVTPLTVVFANISFVNSSFSQRSCATCYETSIETCGVEVGSESLENFLWNRNLITGSCIIGCLAYNPFSNDGLGHFPGGLSFASAWSWVVHFTQKV